MSKSVPNSRYRGRIETVQKRGNGRRGDEDMMGTKVKGENGNMDDRNEEGVLD